MSRDYSDYWDFVHATERAGSYHPDMHDMLIGKPIYQQYQKLPHVQERTVLMSSWVIGGLPAGLCFREDTSIITNNNSAFLPHTVSGSKRGFKFHANKFQGELRK